VGKEEEETFILQKKKGVCEPRQLHFFVEAVFDFET